MKKKILSIVLALCVVLSTAATLTVTGLAADDTTVTGNSNDGKTFAQSLTAGDTTLNIDDTADWAAFVEAAKTNNFSGKTINLNIDVTLNDKASFNALTATDFTGVNKWTPIPLFSGILDGGNHTISGMYVEGQGFAKQMKSVTVRNLKFDNCYVINTVASTGYGGSETGILTGYIPWDNGSTITNVHTANSKVQCTNANEGVGGIVGMAGGKTLTVSNCTNGATVINGGSTPSNQNLLAAGGIVGTCNNTIIIDNCKNTGSISANGESNNTSAGGILGGIYSASPKITIQNCENLGDVSAYGVAGGIFGGVQGSTDATVTVSDSVNTADVTASSYAGGIIGRSKSKVELSNVVNFGSVTSNTSYAGGIVAYVENNPISMTDSMNIGNVTGSSRTGGLIGVYKMSTGTFTRCLSLGSVTTTTSNAAFYSAAFIGDFSQTVDNTGKTEDTYAYIVFDNCYYTPNLTVAANNGSIYADRAVVAFFDSVGKNIGNFKIINGTGNTQTTTLVIGGVTNAGVQYAAGINAYNAQFKRNENDVNLASRAWQGEIYEVSGAQNLTTKGFNFGGDWYICDGAPVPTKAAIKSAALYENASIVYKGYQNSIVESNTLDIRVVAGLMSRDYNSVGFEVTLVDADGVSETINKSSDTVYTQLNAVVGSDITAVTAEKCGCEFLTAITFAGFPTTADTTYSLVVKPYTTFEGATLYGTTIVILVENGSVVMQYAI